MNQLKAGALLSYVIIGLNIVIGLAYTPFLLRTLGQSEYGIYSLAISVIGYLTVLDLGFGNAVVRYTAKFRTEGKTEEQYEMFGMFFRLYIIIGIGAFVVGILLMLNVGYLFGETMNGEELDKMRIMMILMSFNLAFTFPLSIFGSIISAYENFVFIKVVNIFRVVGNPIVMILLLLFGYKAIALVIVTTLFNLITLLTNCWYCFKKLKIRLIFRKTNYKFLKEVSIYSFWIFLGAIMDHLYWGSGQFILGMYQGASIVAVYALAIQLKAMFFMFSSAISGVFLPKITGMITNNATDEEVSELFIRTGRIQFIVVSFILSGFIVLGKQFIDLWAGEGYDDVYIISLLFFITSTIPLIQNIGIVILQAKNQMKFRSLLYIVLSVFSVIIAIPLSIKYGGIGCAVATSLALLLGQGLIINIYYHRVIKLNIPKFWLGILKMSIIPILIVTLSLQLIPNIYTHSIISFFKISTFFTAIYLVLFWMFSLNKYEKNLFKGLIKRFIP